MKRLAVNLVVALFIVSAAQGQYTYETYAEPFEIFINDSPAPGQVFTVGQPITVSCHLHARASHSGAAWNRAKVSLSVKASWLGFNSYDQAPDNVQEYPTAAEVELDELFQKTYTSTGPQSPGTYFVRAGSQALAWYKEGELDYWTLAEPDGYAAEIVTLYFVVEPDTTPPVITLNGDAIVTLECGVDSYTESGATAVDDVDGTVDVVIGGDVVNTEVCGTYVVTYDASDGSGNPAAQVTRTVIVQDTTGPVITLVGDNPQTIECPNAYVELGATATDNIDGDLSGSIVIDATAVDTSVPGSYFVTYDVSDAAGNAAIQVTRTVSVVESAQDAPQDVVEDIIHDIELLDVPEDAQKEMGKAVKELNKAIDEFNNDKIDKALDKIAKAVKELMKAQEDGALTEDFIDDLVELAEGIADEAIKDAFDAVYPDIDNHHLVKAQEHFVKAGENWVDGKYDKAIKEFKKAYTEAMKALG